MTPTCHFLQHPGVAKFHYAVAMAKNWKNSTLAERLQYVMDEMDWQYKAELARAVNTPHQSTVGNWFLRDGSMDPKYAFRLQDKHRWNARWLLQGEGPERIPAPDPEVDEIIKEIQDLPKERIQALRAILLPR